MSDSCATKHGGKLINHPISLLSLLVQNQSMATTPRHIELELAIHHCPAPLVRGFDACSQLPASFPSTAH